MSFSDNYDTCMANKGFPPLCEIFSTKTVSEALEILEEIDSALEAAGGKELTFGGLAALGPALGLSASATEVVGVLAGAIATTAIHLYLASAIICASFAVVKENLLAELDAMPDGSFKDQIQAAESSGAGVA